ncbi:MAG: phosphatidylglycerol lysyltransferase domain-containing protein [Parvularculaceae bacterium]
MTDADAANTKRARVVHALARESMSWLAPRLSGLIVFLIGASLLLAAAAPDALVNVRYIRRALPLSVVEASHFVASISGTLLIMLAFGVWRRLGAAWVAAMTLMPVGALAAILFGAHYWYAAMLLAGIFVLFIARDSFTRPTALAAAVASPSAIALAAALAVGVVCLGLWNFRDVAYRHDLWWTFAFDGQASRFLRSVVVSFVVVLLVVLWRALAPPAAPPLPALDDGLRTRLRAALAGATSGYVDANLAFLGDKRFIFSDSGETFVMYGVHARTWIIMGAPAGKPDEAIEVMTKFLDACETYRAQPVVYSFRPDMLPLMLEFGLVVRKIGESAIVPLAGFSLDGKARAKLRQAKSRGERDGASFRVLTAEETVACLDRLHAISDEWLAHHHGQEKGFSLGRFERAYLSEFPTAVIERAGEIVAFANLWTMAAGKALSIDLMRYGAGAPHGAMDYLFVELALWGRDNGYVSLDLGMAPLAGLRRERAAPLTSKLGAAIYESAEDIYGFEGLRKFKEKFAPEWEPLYAAARDELSVGAGLVRAGLLTSGGLKGVFDR